MDYVAGLANRRLNDFGGGSLVPNFARDLIIGRLDPIKLLFNGTELQFIPVSDLPTGSMGWWDIVGDHLLRTPIGCFLPGFFGQVSLARVVRAINICNSVSRSDDE